ncbi:MAG: DnaJ domain-containing protein [Candidatus Contendobacter sp.]|nr:DnaJ domain-containing protein [Candidatus Contendobacter sp.]
MTDIIDLALACYRKPLDCQDRFSLAVPLPEGMDRLLWLANGSPEALEAAIRQTSAKPQELRDAARFCIQQWCLARGADPYRVLGVRPDVSPEQIKEHYRLLMRLFHPDRAAGHETWTDHYASRINEAWAILSRSSDRTLSDKQQYPEQTSPQQIAHHPATDRTVERLRPLSSRHTAGRRPQAQRRWLSRLMWGGLTLAAVMILVLGGFYLDHFGVGPSGFRPARAINSDPSPRAVTAPEPIAVSAVSADLGALGPLLAAPDWQALERREQQAQRQVTQLREQRAQWEQTRQQQIVAEGALLESMREERAQLEEQINSEQTRMKQVQAERLAAEQQRLARLQAEQARVAQERTERELVERRRLEALQAEQAKAEQLVNKLRVERERLEQLKAEQARTDQAKSEQAKMEQMQVERQRLEEQLKAERARAAQVKIEQAKMEQVQAERQRLEEQLKAERARAAQVKIEQAKMEQVQAERQRLEEQLKTERARTEQARLEAVANRAPAVPMTVAVETREQGLTAGELEGLMDRYIRAYQGGDLSGVMALFATGARSRIRQDYAALFANHYIRGFRLRDLRWAYRGQSASGSGRYELQLRRRDSGEQHQVEGRIRFTVQKRDSQLLIEAIEYDWPEKG